ncbi:MAG: nucleotidyltransferase family protein [Polaromonas sp.]
MLSAGRLIEDALQNRFNRAILERLPALGLPDAWLVAGCLFQTIWNLQSGLPPEARIKDYDLFYFDAADLSESAEQAVQQQVTAHYRDLPVEIEIKNQARVHTWYPEYFGHSYPALQSSRDGIERFLVTCTCVGITSRDGHFQLYAPNGLDELYAGQLQANPLCDHNELFQAKAASYARRWPWLNTVGQPLVNQHA